MIKYGETGVELGNRTRYGVVPIKVQPLMKYEIIGEWATDAIQFIMMKVQDMNIKMAYVAVKTGEEDEEKLLSCIRKCNTRKTVLM